MRVLRFLGTVALLGLIAVTVLHLGDLHDFGVAAIRNFK